MFDYLDEVFPKIENNKEIIDDRKKISIFVLSSLFLFIHTLALSV